MKNNDASCIACTAAGLAFFGNREGYTYYRCQKCGTLQLSPLPDEEALANAYKQEYAATGHCQSDPEARNRAAVPQFEGIVAALCSHCSSSLVLDYGAGWGGLLTTLARHNINAEGAEISSDMATYCQDKGHHIHQCSLEDIEGRERYDAIVLSSVFEHLVSHEPWLANARRLLKPNGVVVSLQPTAVFATLLATIFRLGITERELPQLHQIFCPPWHTVLFSKAGMTSLADRCEFDVVAVTPAPLQKQKGATGLMQRTLSLINTVATPVFGEKWPLWTGHIFVLQKRS